MRDTVDCRFYIYPRQHARCVRARVTASPQAEHGMSFASIPLRRSDLHTHHTGRACCRSAMQAGAASLKSAGTCVWRALCARGARRAPGLGQQRGVAQVVRHHDGGVQAGKVQRRHRRLVEALRAHPTDFSGAKPNLRSEPLTAADQYQARNELPPSHDIRQSEPRRTAPQ